MPFGSFPITAPRFTDEDERRELEGLSEAERAEIDQDVNGADAKSDLDELDSILARTLVTEAMKTVDPSKREAYDRVVQRNEQLVYAESDPMCYLRCCQRDPWKAAQRLAEYWEARVKIFGDKAFLPLITAGEPALTTEAAQLLKTCVFTRLENDSHHRTVLFFDRSKLPPDTRLRHGILQVFFYVSSMIATQSELTNQNGLVLLVYGHINDINRFDRRRLKEGLCLLRRGAFSFDIKAVHMCFVNLRPPFNYLFPIAKFLFGKRLRRRLIVHSGCGGQISNELEKQYGLSRESLPSQLGGKLDTSKSHQCWLQRCRTKSL